MAETSLTIDEEVRERLDDYRHPSQLSWSDVLDAMMDRLPTVEEIEDACSNCGEEFRTAGPYDEMGGFVQWYTLPDDLGGDPQVAFFCSRSCLEQSFEMKDTYLPESPDRLVVGGAEVPRVEIEQSLSFYKDGHRTSVGIDLPGLFTGDEVPYDYEGEPLYVQNRGTWIETGVVEEIVHDDDHTTLLIENNRTIEKAHHPDPEQRSDGNDPEEDAAA